jgi:succinate dehydrogenase / fumarate reductase, cytochrome b subunit
MPMRRHQERSKLMKAAADRYMHIQPIQPGAPSIAPGRNIPVAGISTVLSIVHRFTGGVALAVGSVLLAWSPVAVAAGGEVFRETRAFITSPIGLVLLFCWSVAFFYHLCSDVRHLAWDAGYGFDIRNADRSGYAVLVATALLTALAWLYVFHA